MARIPGSVPVTGFVAPTSDSDTYASHSEEWGRGGYRSVYSITDRNDIPYQRRLEGMLVHVKKNGNTYRLDGGVQNINWEIRQEGGGEGEGLTPELQEWLLDRLNHTGTQPISTIEELEEALLGKVDKDGYKQLSEQNFTEELRDIVLSVEPSHFKGLYPNEEALLTAYPTGVAGDEAQVDSGTGLPVAVYIWDAVNTGWTLQQGVSALPSAPQVRQLYLANPDTKEFKGADRVKLDNIAPESTKNSLDSFLLNRANHSGKQPIESVEGLALALQTALENSLTEEQKDAVDEMVVGATKNKTDDFLLNRANHTGTQTMATIEGLAFKFLVLESSAMTALEKDLLSTVQRDATKNASDEELLNRANHEGTQSLETIDGLVQLLAAKVDKVGNKQLTDENFTAELKELLLTVQPSNFKGLYVNFTALSTAHATAKAGDYAFVDAGSGFDVEFYIWDGSDNKWIKQESTVATLTAPEVRQLYLSNPDTENFSTGYMVKLGNIAPEATKNSLDSFLLNRENHTSKQAINTVTGLADALSGKQEKLVRGITIKDVNGQSLLGAGNIEINADVLGSTGNSEIKPMSQKATTDALNALQQGFDSALGDMAAVLLVINGEAV